MEKSLMVSTKNTQSLTDFRQNATATLDRLNETGEAHVLTINGKAKAVLVAPDVFDDMTRQIEDAHDASMRRSIQESKDGKVIPLDVAFARIRDKVIAMQAAQKRERSTPKSKLRRAKAK